MLNDSRLRNGTLTLGPTATEMDFSCQITNVRVTSAYSDDGNSVNTLCGDTVPAPRKSDGHKLEGTLVQDFDLAEADGGVIDYLWNHDLEVVDFTFTPDDLATAPVLTGKVQIEIPADTYGGDVNTRTTSDFAWSIQGDVTRTYAGGAARGSSYRRRRGVTAEVRVVGELRLNSTLAQAGKRIGDMKDGFAEAAGSSPGPYPRAAPRRTGRLAGSFRPALEGGPNSVTITSPLVYAVPVHWGRPAHGIEANPFVIRAVDQTETQWMAALEADAQRICDGVEGA